MTSAHSMQSESVALHTALRIAALALLLIVLGGCQTGERLQPPTALTAPYDRPELWAVVPFANESGVSHVQGDRVADIFAEQIEQVSGLHALPVNRVILAMRQLGMRSVNSPDDAIALLQVLGADALIVGTVTSYDPYPPPKLGAALQLFRNPMAMPSSQFDPVAFTRASTDEVAPGAIASASPISQAAGVFDATNHQTLQWLDEYAAGRSEPDSAYGRRIYQVSMELYTQFVAHRLMRDLLECERARLTPMAIQTTTRR